MLDDRSTPRIRIFRQATFLTLAQSSNFPHGISSGTDAPECIHAVQECKRGYQSMSRASPRAMAFDDPPVALTTRSSRSALAKAILRPSGDQSG